MVPFVSPVTNNYHLVFVPESIFQQRRPVMRLARENRLRGATAAGVEETPMRLLLFSPTESNGRRKRRRRRRRGKNQNHLFLALKLRVGIDAESGTCRYPLNQ